MWQVINKSTYLWVDNATITNTVANIITISSSSTIDRITILLISIVIAINTMYLDTFLSLTSISTFHEPHPPLFSYLPLMDIMTGFITDLFV